MGVVPATSVRFFILEGKEDVVPTLLPVVEAVLIPSIRRTRVSSNCQRAVSAHTGDVDAR